MSEQALYLIAQTACVQAAGNNATVFDNDIVGYVLQTQYFQRGSIEHFTREDIGPCNLIHAKVGVTISSAGIDTNRKHLEGFLFVDLYLV